MEDGFNPEGIKGNGLEKITKLIEKIFSDYHVDFFGYIFADIDSLGEEDKIIPFSGNPAMRFYFNSRLEIYDENSLKKAQEFSTAYQNSIGKISLVKKY